MYGPTRFLRLALTAAESRPAEKASALVAAAEGVGTRLRAAIEEHDTREAWRSGSPTRSKRVASTLS
jgi:hypothetical protein